MRAIRACDPDVAGCFPLIAEKRVSRFGEIHEARRDRPPVLGAPVGQAWLLGDRRAAGGSQPFPARWIFRVGTFRLNAAGSR